MLRLPAGVVLGCHVRIGEAASVLARSFAHDPAFTYVFPEWDRRIRALPPFFRQAITDALPFGGVLAAVEGQRVDGVAVWLPAGRFPLSAGRKLRAVPRMLPVLLAAPRSFPALSRLGASVERTFPRGRAYWYLEAVGVDEGRKGAGIGTRLVKPVLEVADATGTPCYLETVSERNVRWYERLGFRVDRENLPFLDGGPTYWTMIREPRGEASSKRAVG